MESSQRDLGLQVWIDLAQGIAHLANVRVSIASAGTHGELQVAGRNGTTLRPLHFLERNRAVLRALATPDPAASLSAEVLQLATVQRGEGEAIVLETLALFMAGAILQSRSISFAETALMVARAGGWELSQIEAAEAQFVDHLANELIGSGEPGQKGTMQNQSGWTTILFNQSPEQELEGLRHSLAEALLQRARPATTQQTPQAETRERFDNIPFRNENHEQKPDGFHGNVGDRSISRSDFPSPSISPSRADLKTPSSEIERMERLEQDSTVDAIQMQTNLRLEHFQDGLHFAPDSSGGFLEAGLKEAGDAQSVPMDIPFRSGIPTGQGRMPALESKKPSLTMQGRSNLAAFDFPPKTTAAVAVTTPATTAQGDSWDVSERSPEEEIYDLSNLDEVADALAASLQDEADLRGIDL